MRADVLRHLLEEIEFDSAGHEIKEHLRQLVRRIASRNGVNCFVKDEQIAFVQHQLAMRTPRAAIRQRLMSGFDISRSQAYRIIEEALQLSQKPPIFGTPK